MSQVVIRGNLSADSFPFLSELSGRTIVVKQYDQNYIPAVSSKEDPDKDFGVPSVLYCENVLPTSQGYQSVGYLESIPTTLTYNEKVICTIKLGGTDVLVCTRTGSSFASVYRFGDYTTPLITSLPALTKYSLAVINGIVYLYCNGGSHKKYLYTIDNNYTSVTDVTSTVLGLDLEGVLGITSCQGYMIAWGTNTVYWSSLLSPVDFVPSLSTGAGGGSVQALKGTIIRCVVHTIGFVIYSTENMIACPYSGNNRYPFNFREIPSSSGLSNSYTPLDQTLVTIDPVTGNHYVRSTSGLQLVTMQQTNTVFPEATDFLSASIMESFNKTTKVFSVTPRDDSRLFYSNMCTYADRYIIISYGQNNLDYFTHALVYDTALKRWGKLMVDHVAVVTGPATVYDDKLRLSVIQKDGTVLHCMIDIIDPSGNTSSGVVLIGKYQHVRQRFIQLQTVEIENIKQTHITSVGTFYTLDGKTPVYHDGYELSRSANVRKYGFRVTGLNCSILIMGCFNLVSIILAFNVHGRR